MAPRTPLTREMREQLARYQYELDHLDGLSPVVRAHIQKRLDEAKALAEAADRARIDAIYALENGVEIDIPTSHHRKQLASARRSA